jgi:hypothetical protein
LFSICYITEENVKQKYFLVFSDDAVWKPHATLAKGIQYFFTKLRYSK